MSKVFLPITHMQCLLAVTFCQVSHILSLHMEALLLAVKSSDECIASQGKAASQPDLSGTAGHQDPGG